MPAPTPTLISHPYRTQWPLPVSALPFIRGRDEGSGTKETVAQWAVQHYSIAWNPQLANFPETARAAPYMHVASV